MRSHAAALLVLLANPSAGFAACRFPASRGDRWSVSTIGSSVAPRGVVGRGAALAALDPAASTDAAVSGAKSAAILAAKISGGAVGVGGIASLLPPISTLAVAVLTKQVE